MAGAQNLYLKPGRLNDILAAIQTMAIHEKYRCSSEEWAYLISGDKDKATEWQAVFSEHPEFFRPSLIAPGHYALIWRRAGKAIEYVRDSGKVGRTRPPVPENQIKTLLDTAIELHKNESDAKRDRRWWIAPVSTGITSLVVAVIGLVGVVIGGVLKSH